MSADRMTLVERLLNPQWVATVSGLDGAHAPRLDEQVAIAVMREAAERIKFLEGLAGAVTPGESFKELREKAKS